MVNFKFEYKELSQNIMILMNRRPTKDNINIHYSEIYAIMIVRFLAYEVTRHRIFQLFNDDNTLLRDLRNRTII